jgi:hypothetical protein
MPPPSKPGRPNTAKPGAVKPGSAKTDPAAQERDSLELDKEVTQLDSDVDRLRTLYEQYFQGIERNEPVHQRDTIKHRLNVLHTANIKNTAIRFRVQQLVAKYNTYQNYWQRICKQIEEGTYARDLFKARMHARERERQKKTAGEAPGDAERQAPPEDRPAAARPVGLSDDQVQAIYNAYVLAKRRCKEDAGNLSADGLGSTLRKQIPTIMKQYKCKSVEFKVVIKGGKAMLKAVPKF